MGACRSVDAPTGPRWAKSAQALTAVAEKPKLSSMATPKIDPTLHQAKKPEWIKVRLPSNPVFFSTKALVADLRLHTFCEIDTCSIRGECGSQATPTFMCAGERCPRACGFCAVATAKPFALEADEPQRVAEAV